MRLLFTFLCLLSTLHSYSCSCRAIDLKEEIKTTKDIFVGRVISRNDEGYERYTIEVLKTWKGQPEDTIKLIQGMGGCEKWAPLEGDYYVFLLNGKAVNQCSRTAPYRRANYIPILDSTFNSFDIDPIHTALIDSLEYNRKYIIKLYETAEKWRIIDIKGANVFYLEGKLSQWYKENSINKWWDATNYYLVAENASINADVYDYIIYAEWEGMIEEWNEKKANKMYKRIRRKLGNKFTGQAPPVQ